MFGHAVVLILTTSHLQEERCPDCNSRLLNTEMFTRSQTYRTRRPCCGNADTYKDLVMSIPPLSAEWKAIHRMSTFQRFGRKANHLCSFAVASPSQSGVKDDHGRVVRARGVHLPDVEVSAKNPFRCLRLEGHNVFVSDKILDHPRVSEPRRRPLDMRASAVRDMHWFIADGWEMNSKIPESVRALATYMRNVLRTTHVVAHQAVLPVSIGEAIKAQGAYDNDDNGATGDAFMPCTNHAWVSIRGNTMSQPYLVAIYRHPSGNGRNFVPEVQFVSLKTRKVLLDGWWDVMAYPAIFPMNALPWVFCPDAASRLSRRDFLCFLIYTQYSGFWCTRLTQEYLLNCYSSIRAESLFKHRLRIEEFRKGASKDDMRSQPQDEELDDAADLPDRFFSSVPESEHGGPTYFKQVVCKGLFVASSFQSVNVLFWTMTVSPQWPCIKELFAVDGRSNRTTDCHLLETTRAFCGFRELARQSFESGDFLPNPRASSRQRARRCQWSLDSMENQGRGLCHVHGVTCYGGDRWTPSDIDCIVWATVPTDEQRKEFRTLYKDVDLRALVLKFQVHKCGPNCYTDVLDSCGRSTGNQVCKKGFPKMLTPVTVVHDRNAPTYRRFTEQDRYIVPYNPHQLCRAQCHVCVEVTVGARAIPYILAYTGKGDPHARCAIYQAQKRAREQGHHADAITEYQAKHTIVAPEAVARILKEPYVSLYPPVRVIQVHGSDAVPATVKAFVAFSDIQKWLNRPLQEPYLSMTLQRFVSETFTVDAGSVPQTALTLDDCHVLPSRRAGFSVYLNNKVVLHNNRVRKAQDRVSAAQKAVEAFTLQGIQIPELPVNPHKRAKGRRFARWTQDAISIARATNPDFDRGRMFAAAMKELDSAEAHFDHLLHNRSDVPLVMLRTVGRCMTERYCMRLFLVNVASLATTHQELLTWPPILSHGPRHCQQDVEVLTTFSEVCEKAGLFSNAGLADAILREAVHSQIATPEQVTNLLVMCITMLVDAGCAHSLLQKWWQHAALEGEEYRHVLQRVFQRCLRHGVNLAHSHPDFAGALSAPRLAKTYRLLHGFTVLSACRSHSAIQHERTEA
jgi:hypothetical protein